MKNELIKHAVTAALLAASSLPCISAAQIAPSNNWIVYTAFIECAWNTADNKLYVGNLSYNGPDQLDVERGELCPNVLSTIKGLGGECSTAPTANGFSASCDIKANPSGNPTR